MRMVLNSALALICAGLVTGVPLAIAWTHVAGRWIRLLIDSAWPIGLAAASMVAAALIAAYVPARRLARVEPTDALRHE
jgi:ABC-type antimicrobial peptide transport system permease subunit